MTVQRLLLLAAVLGALGCTAIATAATPPRSCAYAAPPTAFPDVQHLAVSGGACTAADRAAASIQRYWRAHSRQPPARALPHRVAGFTCRYRLRHERTGDPYYVASCRRARTQARMQLTS